MKKNLPVLLIISTVAVLTMVSGCTESVALPDALPDASLSIQNNFGVAIEGLAYNNTSYDGSIAQSERVTLTVPAAQTGLHKIRFQSGGNLYATIESVYTQPGGVTAVDVSPNMSTVY